MRMFLVILITVSVLSACTSSPADVLEETATTTIVTTTEYTDNRLCFRVETVTDWFVDGVAGGFASFRSPTDQPTFRMTRVYLGVAPTLTDVLNNMHQGSEGQYIEEVRETTIDGQSALWLTIVLVVLPLCGEEINTFFISAADSSEEQFVNFLDSISLTL